MLNDPQHRRAPEPHGPPGRRARRWPLLLLTVSLLASGSAAVADPMANHSPTLPPLDGRGLLESVAATGSQVISNVRDRASDLVDSAMNFLGVRYRFGGSSVETGFDCSGFTRYVFEHSLGKVLPHRADEQANDPDLIKVDRNDLRPGDLVFFDTLRRTFSHVGIYLGDGKFIHAPRSGESVRVEDLSVSYWARRFTGARRLPELAGRSPHGTDPNASLVAQFMAAAAPAGGPAAVASPAPAPSPAATVSTAPGPTVSGPGAWPGIGAALGPLYQPPAPPLDR